MNANEHPRKSKVDVLIVGAGPAGLMAATWLSRLGVSIRIVDKRGTKVYNGQADGLQSRTLEIFDSFDIAHRALREISHPGGFITWTPDQDGNIKRGETVRTSGTFMPPCRFRSGTLHQGRIERFLIDAIAEMSGTVVERGVLPESLEVDNSTADLDDENTYPVRLRLRHLTEEEATPKATTTIINGQAVQNGLFRSNMAADDTADVLQRPLPDDAFTEEVQAKYLVGCDGAHSWIRNQVGIQLQGESTDYVWGVLDVRIITDFPDIRMLCPIQSANAGSILIIPRERGLTRIYVQLSTVNTSQGGGAKFDRSAITPELIMDSARKISHPYKIKFQEIEWWTVYQIGQRVADQFAFQNRVFLAGDAVHTHSPKAGQGMNVSMADSYNLGWKLGAVVQGLCKPSLLTTYELERRSVAQQLIDFDYKLSRTFSGGPPKDKETLFQLYLQNMEFMTGMYTDYAHSLIVAKDNDDDDDDDPSTSSKVPTIRNQPHLASGIQVGRRIPDYQVIKQVDNSPHYIHRLLPSNGRWRILLFAGDLTQPSQVHRLQAICEQLNDAPDSPIHRFTPASRPFDGLIEVFGIHSGICTAVADDFPWPSLLRPYRPATGWDLDRVFADDQGTRTYANFGIDANAGCAVIVRPDHSVSWVGALDDYASIRGFFERFMKVQPEEHAGAVRAPEDWAGY